MQLGFDVVGMGKNAETVSSWDQCLAEVAREVRDVARTANRWLRIVAVFPHGADATANGGIDRTDWCRMDRAFYDLCFNPGECVPRR